jgi:hypothetical protein
VDTASIDKGYPAVSAGASSDGSDAVSQIAYLGGWTEHQFVPPTQVIIASGVKTVEYDYYPRWHMWPATV